LVQEALTNVAKHAGATQVRVRLHRGAQDRAEVEVHDDGAGFDRAGVRSGAHGLLGMRHRVEAAGGRFALLSAPGRGTRIQASLPARPAAAG
ncbi:MAG: sensor histidine kinase, partial [Gammaproteobacteria bacterium]